MGEYCCGRDLVHAQPAQSPIFAEVPEVVSGSARDLCRSLHHRAECRASMGGRPALYPEDESGGKTLDGEGSARSDPRDRQLPPADLPTYEIAYVFCCRKNKKMVKSSYAITTPCDLEHAVPAIRYHRRCFGFSGVVVYQGTRRCCNADEPSIFGFFG